MRKSCGRKGLSVFFFSFLIYATTLFTQAWRPLGQGNLKIREANEHFHIHVYPATSGCVARQPLMPRVQLSSDRSRRTAERPTLVRLCVQNKTELRKLLWDGNSVLLCHTGKNQPGSYHCQGGAPAFHGHSGTAEMVGEYWCGKSLCAHNAQRMNYVPKL